MNRENTNNTNSDLNRINTIQRLPVLRSFKSLLGRLHSHADCHNRQLHYDQYVSLMLLYFFNPTFTGLRSIQHASKLDNVQKKLGIKRTSLGSLPACAWHADRSEASHVFDPHLLTPIINELVHDVAPLKLDNRLDKLDMELVAFDGSLLKALPKMLWALWLDEDHRAVKIHLEFDIHKGAPLQAQVTDANESEIAKLESVLAPGKLYCLDAAYAKYKFLEKIIRKSSSFVVRLRDNASYETIKEHTLTQADREAAE
jgi:hypothetical protein